VGDLPVPDHGDLPQPGWAVQIDGPCDQFEAEWRTGRRPRIDDYLQMTPEPARSELFRELLKIEVELRRKAGESPIRPEYTALFPGFTQVIDSVFRPADPWGELDPASARGVAEDGFPESWDRPDPGERPSEENPADVTAAVADLWKPGDVIIGLYEVTQVHESGGMGLVYRVHHREWNVDLAVKSPRLELFPDERSREDFEREAETWVTLGQHPHTVGCYYVRRLGGIPRIFAEYVEGGTLADWIRGGKLYEGGPERARERILDLAMQIAWGLHHAHEGGLVHQDVKPGNVLLTAAGNAKVTDFGLARTRGTLIKPADRTSSSSQAEPDGTLLVSMAGLSPAYCSPEQKRRGPLSRKTDIWSWGVTVLEMFAGVVAWREGPSAEASLEELLGRGHTDDRLPTIPSALAELLRHCFRQDPRDRPDDMIAITTALRAAYREATRRDYPRELPREAEALADGLNNRAVSLLDLGKPEQAEALWEQALRVRPNHPEAIYNLGLVRWRAARMADDALVAALGDVARSAPKHGTASALLAEVHLERGDHSSAIKLLASITDPGVRHALAVKATALARERASKARHLSSSRFPYSPDADPPAIDTLRRGRGWWSFRTWGFDEGQFIVTTELKPPFKSSETEVRFPNPFEKSSGTQARVIDGMRGRCLNTLTIPEPNAICVGADGRRLLVGGDFSDGLSLWDVATGRCVQEFHHEDVIQHATLSDDGRLALSVTRRAVLLWEVETGRCRHTLTVEGNCVSTVRVGKDWRHVLVGGSDPTLRWWDLDTGSCVQTLRGHTHAVNAVALGSDGNLAVSASDDRTLRLWDLATGCCLRTFTGHVAEVQAVDLSDDGRRVLSGGADRTLRLWELATGRCLRTVTLDDLRFPLVRPHHLQVRFLDDGRCALVRILDIQVEGSWKTSHWSIEPGVNATLALCRSRSSEETLETQQRFVSSLELARCQWSRGNAADAARSLRAAREEPGYEYKSEAFDLWTALYTALPRTSCRDGWTVATFVGHAVAVNAVCLSPDGQFALSAAADHTVRLWEVATGRRLRVFEGHTDAVNAVCMGDGGRLALSGGADRTLRLWEVATGRCLHVFEGDFEGKKTLPPDSLSDRERAYEIVVSSATEFFREPLLERLKRREAERRDKPARALHNRIGGHAHHVTSVAMTVDGRFALSGSLDETLKLWDLASGLCLRTIEGHSGYVRSVGLSDDGRLALSAHDIELSPLIASRGRRTLQLWDVATGRCLGVFEGHSSGVGAACIGGDGRLALSGGADRTLRLWDVATGRCLRVVESDDGFRSLCQGRDGRFALSVGNASTIKLWDLESGRCVHEFAGHTAGLNAVCLSDDGRHVLSGAEDGTLTLWTLDWGLEEAPASDWDEGARPYLETFLTLKTPAIAPLPEGRRPDADEIRLALSRRGRPSWSEEDLQTLLRTLGCAGLGWLRAEGLRRALDEMARAWTGPPPLPVPRELPIESEHVSESPSLQPLIDALGPERTVQARDELRHRLIEGISSIVVFIIILFLLALVSSQRPRRDDTSKMIKLFRQNDDAIKNLREYSSTARELEQGLRSIEGPMRSRTARDGDPTARTPEGLKPDLPEARGVQDQGTVQPDPAQRSPDPEAPQGPGLTAPR
jgi:WD40 repeat protein/serine/threonine protein kinase